MTTRKTPFVIFLLLMSPYSFLYAQVDQTEVAMQQSFTLLLQGQSTDAKESFTRTQQNLSPDSYLHWLSKEFIALSENITGEFSYQEGMEGTKKFQEAFSLLTQEKSLEAQSLFLQVALLYPDGSSYRNLAKACAQISVDAQSFSYQAPAPVSEPPNALSPPANNTLSDQVPVESATQNNASGGFSLIMTGSLFGIFSGIVLDVDLEIQDERLAVAIPLVGGIVGGLGGYAYYKGVHGGEFSRAKAAPVSSGTLIGAGEGLLISALANAGEDGILEDITLGGAALGLGAGILVSELIEPKEGDTFLVTSATAWGTILAAESLGLIQSIDGTTNEVILTLGYNAGLLGGVLLASNLDMSTRRTAIVDGSGLLGGIAGTLTGLLIVGVDLSNQNQGRVVAGSAMAGTLGGLGLGYYLTRNIDKTETEKPLAFSLDGIFPSSVQTRDPNDQGLSLNARFSF